MHRAGRISPAAPVLAGPVFSQGKSKIPVLQKASNKQSARVIFGLIRLIISSYNRKDISTGARYLPPTHSIYCYAQKLFCCAKAKYK